MKDEVPPSIVDAHTKTVLSAGKEGGVEPTFGLEKSGIAGTGVWCVCMFVFNCDTSQGVEV